MKKLKLIIHSVLLLTLLLLPTYAFASIRASIMLIEPSIMSVSSTTIEELKVGHPFVISTTATKKDNTMESFFVIIEVRNSDGITKFFGWQSASLKTIGDEAAVGMSWIPEEAGTYSLRTFAVTGFTNPEALSGVTTSDAAVTN